MQHQENTKSPSRIYTKNGGKADVEKPLLLIEVGYFA